MIDAHVHLDLKNYLNYKKATNQLLSRMDKANIEKAIIMPNDMYCDSEAVRKACKLHPGRLVGFYMYNSIDKTISADELKRILEAGNFKGIKIHPRNQKIYLDDHCLDIFLDKCNLFKFPIYIDCFPFGIIDERNYPLAFERIAKKFPSLRLIIGHMGGYRAFDAFMVAKSNTNIYLDLSFTFMYFRGSSIEKDIGYMVKSLSPTRFIYGSDYPSMDMKDSSATCLNLLKTFDLGKKDISSIMGGNIKLLLGLK